MLKLGPIVLRVNITTGSNKQETIYAMTSEVAPIVIEMQSFIGLVSLIYIFVEGKAESQLAVVGYRCEKVCNAIGNLQLNNLKQDYLFN